jgi:hypothetical protein
MKKLFAITAIVVGLLAAGLSAQAGIFSHVLGGKTQLSFTERWAPVDQAQRSGTFAVQGDETVF